MNTPGSPSDQDSQTAQEIRYVAVLLEEMRAQNQTVLEAVGDMRDKVKLIPNIIEKVDALQTDMKIVKAALTDTNHDVRDLHGRVDRLEAAA